MCPALILLSIVILIGHFCRYSVNSLSYMYSPHVRSACCRLCKNHFTVSLTFVESSSVHIVNTILILILPFVVLVLRGHI